MAHSFKHIAKNFHIRNTILDNKNIKFFTEFYRNIFDIPYRNTFVKHEDVEGYPVPYLQPHDSYTRKNRTAVLSEKEMDRVIVRFNKYIRGVKNRENTEALRGHAMESEFFLEVMRRDLSLEAQEKKRARMARPPPGMDDFQKAHSADDGTRVEEF